MTNPIIQKLWDSGSFWNPSKPNANNIRLEDLDFLKLTDAAVIEAIQSFQEADANLHTLSMVAHKRPPIADGDIGPATTNLLAMPRCPMPDFPPPPNATFHYDDPGLQRAVETMQANAMGSGSWPSCDPQRPGVNSFRVNLDTARCGATVKAYLDKALQACVEAYAEIGCALRYILDTPGDCEISKRFESLAGSVIGWNEFPDPNTCDQTIQGRLDTGYAPSDYRYFANLECHETGHGVGLQHGNGSIMNPSILLVWPLTWKGSYSFANLKRWFGGEPLTPVTPPTPPTPGSQTIVTGILNVQRDGQSLGEFIVVPKPGV